MQLEMPAITTRTIPDGDTRRYVEEAYKQINAGPRVGIIEERTSGTVPIHIDPNPPYAGVTEIHPTYNGDVESRRMGISDRLPTFVRVGNRQINYKKRVARHEARHVLSEKLVKYFDGLSPKLGTLIMESYAEFGGIKGKTEEKETVLLTTPYKPAVKFGYFADRFYESEIDGKTGYAAFIRDIQRYKSAKTALTNLGRNIKAAVNRGVDVNREIESAYRSDVLDALRKVDIKPRYLN